MSLSWRLIRAQRMQGMVFESLFTEGILDFRDEADSWLDDLDEAEPEQGRDALATDLAVGRTIRRDFANAKVLERLLAYEQRIEGSLYKAMAELEKLRRVRRADDAATQNKANWQAQGQRHKGTEAQREPDTPAGQNKANLKTEQAVGSRDQAAVQNKANLPAGQAVGGARPADAKQSQSAPTEPDVQNKANLPGQQADAAGTETAAGPMPAGT